MPARKFPGGIPDAVVGVEQRVLWERAAYVAEEVTWVPEGWGGPREEPCEECFMEVEHMFSGYARWAQ